MITATFSIVARCPKTGDMGVATASKHLGVGAVVPWAEEGVGAVATQHWGSPRMGQRLAETGASGVAIATGYRPF